MSNHYTNTVSAVFLLFFHLISSASSSSFLRQYTDDINKHFQQENGAGPDPVQGEAHYLRKHDQEISSRDYKVSASNTVKGLRDRPPSSYSLKMESFNTLLKSTNADKYVSRPFSAAGYKWNIQVYPGGLAWGKGKAVSIFLILNAKEKFRPYEKIYVGAKLRVLNQRNFNNLEKKRKQMIFDNWYNGPGYGDGSGWGYNEFIPFSDLKDSSKGFLVNDILKVEVEIEAISSTKYFPS